MRFPIAICVTAALVAATIGQSAFGAPSAAEKCASSKMQATGKYSLCRMLAEANVKKRDAIVHNQCPHFCPYSLANSLRRR